MVRLFDHPQRQRRAGLIPAALLAVLTLVGSAGVLAHGEHQTPEQIRRELEVHAEANYNLGRALKTCATAPGFAARQERAAARRVEVAHALRRKRGIQSTTIQPAKYKRDRESIEHWMSISHEQANSGFNLDTPVSQLFGGNASCALVPEQTIGPYFAAGELIREDITEAQRGVPLHVEVQFVDMSDCSAVSGMAIDLWQCNATGVYSGVDAPGQAGTASTWLRGVQISDSQGAAGFDTIFPGHYAGRTNHIHVMATRDPRVLNSSSQYTGGIPTHIGQFYFDTSLIERVEAVQPYSGNDKQQVPNDRDGIAVAAATKENDIFMDYVLLGDKVDDGILAWIIVGVDMKADQSDGLFVAATASPSATGGGGGGGGGGAGGTSITSSTATGGALRAMATPFLFGWGR